MTTDKDEVQKLVLIVDDDPTVRLLLSEALETAGFAVKQAEDGSQALLLLEHCTPDLIMLDVLMPGIDGFEVCSRLRAKPGTSDIPIVMVTGINDLASIQRAYDLGVTDFITKPIPWGVIVYRVNFLIRATRAFADLKKSEGQLLQAQRIARVGSWKRELKPDRMWFSDEARRILHLDAHGHERSYRSFINSIHPLDRAAVEQVVAEAIAQNGFFSVDYQLLHNEGVDRFVHTEAEVVKNRDGVPVRLEGIVQDLTERTQVEVKLREYAHTQALLLREVNHRVRNNLAAVINLLHKEEERAKAAGLSQAVPLLGNLARRIDGLLTVDGMLASSGWQPLNLGELCRRLIGGLLTPPGLKQLLQVANTTILVDSDQAHYLALVLNELAMNSIRHAATGTNGLTIAVDLVEKNGMIHLEFRDNGPGYPGEILENEATGNGLGLELIFGTVRQNMAGSVTLFNDNGAVAALAFPQGSISEKRSFPGGPKQGADQVPH